MLFFRRTQGGIPLDTIIDCQDDALPVDVVCPPPPALIPIPPLPAPDVAPFVTIAPVLVEPPVQVDVVFSTNVPLSLFQFTIGTVSPVSQLFSPIDLSQVEVTPGPSFNPNNVGFELDGSSSAGVVFAFSAPLTEAIILPGQDQVVLILDLSALGSETDPICLEVRIRPTQLYDCNGCADGLQDVDMLVFLDISQGSSRVARQLLLLQKFCTCIYVYTCEISRTFNSVARTESQFQMSSSTAPACPHLLRPPK